MSDGAFSDAAAHYKDIVADAFITFNCWVVKVS